MKTVSCLALAWLVAAPDWRSQTPDWRSEDMMHQALVWKAYTTDSTTWSEDGGFGLRWGMGPANVTAHFPSLDTLIPDYPDDESQVGTIDQTVQGMSSVVFLRFRRGSLYAIEVSPLVYSVTHESHPDYSADDTERFWDRMWTWRQELVPVLQQTYGAPFSAPTHRALVQLCGDRVPSKCSIISDEEHRESQRVVRWVWLKGRTRVTLDESQLVFEDIEHPRGSRSGSALTDNLAEQPMETYEDVPTTKKPESAWSLHGWHSFRWGMGPGDVTALLQEKSVQAGKWEFSVRKFMKLTAPDPATLLGAKLNGVFSFQDSR